jgi:hypothetical protein
MPGMMPQGMPGMMQNDFGGQFGGKKNFFFNN